jgi:hypothetical protein
MGCLFLGTAVGSKAAAVCERKLIFDLSRSVETGLFISIFNTCEFNLPDQITPV